MNCRSSLSRNLQQSASDLFYELAIIRAFGAVSMKWVFGSVSNARQMMLDVYRVVRPHVGYGKYGIRRFTKRLGNKNGWDFQSIHHILELVEIINSL